MAWIESHQSLLTHRKTLRAAALLRVDRLKLIGHLHALWWWGLDNATDNGHLGKVLDEEVAEAAMWPTRQAEQLVSCLVEAGFLDRDGAALTLHDWWDYAGKFNSQRELRRESNRNRQITHRQRLRNARVTRDATVTDTARNQSTVPNQPNQPRGKTPPIVPPAMLALLVAAHENTIGTLSPTKAAILDDWASRIPDNEIGEASIEYAFRQAALQGRPTLAYVEGVLKRLEADGWPREMEREHERTAKAKPRRNGERTAEEIEQDPANLAAAQQFIDEHPELAKRQRERRAAAERELGIA